MRYWVFTEEQMEAALAEYCRRFDPAVHEMAKNGVRDFLNSPEAVTHKLQGGASYQPEKV